MAISNASLETPAVNYFLSKRGLIDVRWMELLGEGLQLRISAFASEAPEEGFLCGDFSLADIFAGYVLRIGVQSGLLPKEGRLATYLDRLRARPAAQQARFFDSLDS